MKRIARSTAEFERALGDRPTYVLRLYVAGATTQSMLAIESIQTLCDQHLAGHYKLEVVDVYQHPELAREDQILALPTLIKRLPAPLRKLVGDLSNKERVLLGLGLELVVTGDEEKDSPSKR